MKTVVIKIGEMMCDGYPVTLHINEDGTDWLQTTHARATSIIPATLIPAGTAASVGETEIRKVLEVDGVNNNLERVGQYLYELLFSDEIEAAWNSARQGCGATAGGCSTVLTALDIVPANLRSLPWELLTTPNPLRKRLFLNPSSPFVRGWRADFAHPALTHEWPLRALLVVGSPPDDEVIKDANAREEIATILRALRMLGRTTDAEILLRPSKKELLESYEKFKPHIFHFIGHSGPATNKKPAANLELPPERPYLKFYDQRAASPWEWSVDDIPNDLAGKHPASFAFINSCRTGNTITPGDTLTITECFAQTGMLAVLGMLGNVRDDVAREFASGFYEALATGSTVDVAMSKARQSVNSISGLGVGHRHWAVASLSLTARPDAILAVKPTIDLTLQKQFMQDDILKELSSFVDRQVQRRSLVRIDPYHGAENNQSLLLVRGESGVGKTALVQLFLECCAMRGRKILWVNMRGPTLNFAEALCRISRGDPDSKTLLGQPLEPQQVFNQFHWELPRLLRGEKLPLMPTWKAGYVHPEPANKILQGGDEKKLRENIKRIFSTFCAALQKVAGNSPLIIALDHLNIEQTDFEQYIVPYLLRPIKEHKLSPVRMIVVLSKQDITTYNLEREPDPPLPIGDAVPLPKFRKEEFAPLAYEFFRYNHLPPDKAEEEMQRYLDTIQDDWEPSRLAVIWRNISQP